MNKLLERTKGSWAHTLERLRNNIPFITVFMITFVLILVVSLFDVITSQTVFSLSLSEFSVNQIADRTIIAERSVELEVDNTVIAIENTEAISQEQENTQTAGVQGITGIIEGEEIIKKGFPITEEQYEKLKIMAETPAYVDFRAFANAFLFFLLFGFLTFFLFSPTILGRKLRLKEAVFFAIALLIVYVVTVIGKKTPTFSSPVALTVIIPASFFVMLITIMFEAKFAVFASFLFSFSVLYGSNFSLPAALFILCSCCVSVLIVRKANIRIKLTLVAIALGIINPISILIIETIFGATHSGMFMDTLGVAINGFVSGICLLGFLTPLEYIFNTASVFRLLDLSDLNNPLMQRMLLNAPGTYNHSMLVATLAETACNEIGANGLLARVGSYYHDIGKIEQPEYFVENQRDGNKHDEINPRLSVSVIRNHVKKGVERCYQLHLPSEVIDVVAQHHGNSTIYYFYNEAKKLDASISEDDFSYMGTRPTSKEAAVVMICDTVEAACRTLTDPSVSRLEKFIRKLVMGKYETHQMDNANLTFNDLNRIQTSLVNIMAGYYHSRIEYPNQNDSNDDAPVAPAKKTRGKKIKEAESEKK